MFLINEWVNNEIKEEIKRYLETNKNKNTSSQSLWDTVKTVQRGKFITIQVLLRKQEKISDKESNPTTKGSRKIITKEPKVSRRKEIISEQK